jgi:hypothetical protein
MILPTLADRAWYAYHCLPRDRRGKLPSVRELERDHALAQATLAHIFTGRRALHRSDTAPKIAKALRASESWLRGDAGARGPTLTGMLPPRPGTKWRPHGTIAGWSESVALARLSPTQIVPPGGFLLGAEMPAYRPIDMITPAIAVAAALYAYELSTAEEQERYSTRESIEINAANGARPRASILRRPAAKG